MTTIGERIKTSREKAGYTQKELADRLNISYQAVSKWERNESQPGIDSLVPLADVLDISLDYLLSGKERVAPQTDCQNEIVARFNFVISPKKLDKSQENELIRVTNGYPLARVYELIESLKNGERVDEVLITNKGINDYFKRISKDLHLGELSELDRAIETSIDRLFNRVGGRTNRDYRLLDESIRDLLYYKAAADSDETVKVEIVWAINKECLEIANSPYRAIQNLRDRIKPYKLKERKDNISRVNHRLLDEFLGDFRLFNQTNVKYPKDVKNMFSQLFEAIEKNEPFARISELFYAVLELFLRNIIGIVYKDVSSFDSFYSSLRKGSSHNEIYTFFDIYLEEYFPRSRYRSSLIAFLNPGAMLRQSQENSLKSYLYDYKTLLEYLRNKWVKLSNLKKQSENK